jgi:hypothetical protein
MVLELQEYNLEVNKGSRNTDVSLQPVDVVLLGRNRLKLGLLPTFPVPSP